MHEEIPDGLTHFSFPDNGPKFSLDMVVAADELNKIIKQCQDDQSIGNDPSRYIYLFGEWLNRETKQTFIPGQIRWMIKRIGDDFKEGKGEGGPQPS